MDVKTEDANSLAKKLFLNERLMVTEITSCNVIIAKSRAKSIYTSMLASAKQKCKKNKKKINNHNG